MTYYEPLDAKEQAWRRAVTRYQREQAERQEQTGLR